MTEAGQVSPNGHMNMWVSDRIKVFEELIDQTRGIHAREQESYLRGVIAGIRVLQGAWLNGEFTRDKDAAHD